MEKSLFHTWENNNASLDTEVQCERQVSVFDLLPSCEKVIFVEKKTKKFMNTKNVNQINILLIYWGP
jgi:uncharacterized protein (DUF1919 family)